MTTVLIILAVVLVLVMAFGLMGGPSRVVRRTVVERPARRRAVVEEPVVRERVVEEPAVRERVVEERPPTTRRYDD